MGTASERHNLYTAKGVVIKFMIDDSFSSNQVGHYYSEVHYDGAPDSWVLEIGAHWHEHHAEWMQVLQGRVQFTIAGKDRVVSAGDEAVFIPARVVHSFKCFKGEPTVLREHGDPAGTYKQEFFADLLAQGAITELNFFQVMRAFKDGDTFVSLPGNIQVLEKIFTWSMGYIASWIVPGKSVRVDEEGHVVERERKTK